MHAYAIKVTYKLSLLWQCAFCKPLDEWEVGCRLMFFMLLLYRLCPAPLLIFYVHHIEGPIMRIPSSPNLSFTYINNLGTLVPRAKFHIYDLRLRLLSNTFATSLNLVVSTIKCTLGVLVELCIYNACATSMYLV